MNIRGAQKKALELLGPKAVVEARKCAFYERKDGPRICNGAGSHRQPCPGGLPLFRVGKVVLGMFFEILGEGMTWEEALARAEAHEHRDGCRRCWRKRPCRPIRAIEEVIADLRNGAYQKIDLWWSITEGA